MKKQSPTLRDVHIDGPMSGSPARVSKPWTIDNPPSVAQNWTSEEKRRCVAAANSAIASGQSEDEAIRACISAARRQGKMNNKLLKVNGQEVLLSDLAQAWLEKQTRFTNAPWKDHGSKLSAKDGKIEKRWQVDIIKADDEEQVVYGVPLIPDRKDSQKDRMVEKEIRQTAHDFMLSIHSRVTDNDINHEKRIPRHKAMPVESSILLADTEVEVNGVTKVLPQGAWVVATKIFDNQLWKDIKSGKLKGYSIVGVGRRERIG